MKNSREIYKNFLYFLIELPRIFRAELRKRPFVDRIPDFLGELVIKIQVVHHAQTHGEHFLGLEQVPDIRTGITPANRAVALWVNGAVVIGVLCVFHVERALPGKELAVPGMEILRGAGFATCAMALRDDSLALGDERLNSIPKLAIVLGAEGDGLANGTIAACDYTVRIPMAHGVDSLNVAAASAVAFWELRAKIKSRL